MLQPLERSRIRLFLGAPDAFRYLDTRLESILGNISDEGEILVRECLAALVVIDNLILTVGIPNVGLARVDEIWFQKNASQTVISQQRKAGRNYVARLSIILGVPPYADYFSNAGWPGDNFSGLGGANGGGFYGIG